MTTNRTADFNKGTARLNLRFQAEVHALWCRRAIHAKALADAAAHRRQLAKAIRENSFAMVARGYIDMAIGVRQFGGIGVLP